MSNTEKDNEFYEMADAFIALANKQADKAGMGKVSATFLYAAARYNTYVTASESSSANDLATGKEASFGFFVAEYKKMLEEHFADYYENFDKYIKSKNNTIN